jgi:hypothetical protein
MREKRNAYRPWVGMPEGKTLLGRPKHRRIDKIKLEVLEMGSSGVD